MYRRRYLSVVGVGLLAGCASPDGGGRSVPEGESGSGENAGPPTLAVGESYLLSTGVRVTCGEVERTDVVEVDGEPVSPPENHTWLVVDVRAENVSEESQTLPWRQAFWAHLGEERFQHDVNDLPTAFLYWEGGYNGGDPVEAGVVEEGIVPIGVEAAVADGRATVVYDPIAVDVDTEVWWTE